MTTECHQPEGTDATAQSAPAATPGLAPEDRQCRYTLASGRHCRRWAVRAHEFCHEHGRWMQTRVDGAIEIPLLEDPAAITLTLSQTARQLGWGRMPPPNARGILMACRIAQSNLSHSLAAAKFELAQAKFRLKLHQLKLAEQDLLPASPAASLPAPQPPAPQPPDPQPPAAPPADHPLDDMPIPPEPLSACDPCIAALAAGADQSQLDCEHCPAYIAGNLRAPQLPDPRNPPETSAALCQSDVGLCAPDSQSSPNFLHLKQQWDDALFRAAHQLVSPRDQRWATREERATPFDDVLHAPQTAPPPPIPETLTPTPDLS